jgi:hypothetical protein
VSAAKSLALDRETSILSALLSSGIGLGAWLPVSLKRFLFELAKVLLALFELANFLRPFLWGVA